MSLVMLLVMLRRSCRSSWHVLAMLLGTFLPAETSWSQVGRFLWALPLGASFGLFLWAMLPVMHLVMLLVMLSVVHLWASGDVLGGTPAAFLALPGDAPGYLLSGGDLLVLRWVLPLGASSGHSL